MSEPHAYKAPTEGCVGAPRSHSQPVCSTVHWKTRPTNTEFKYSLKPKLFSEVESRNCLHRIYNLVSTQWLYKNMERKDGS